MVAIAHQASVTPTCQQCLFCKGTINNWFYEQNWKRRDKADKQSVGIVEGRENSLEQIVPDA